MRFSIITAFPDFFHDFLQTSIVGRALKAGLFRVDVVDLRSFGKGAYRQIDDYAFGTGGMVLMPRPLEEALNFAGEGGNGKRPFVVYPSPQGVPLTQDIVESLFHQEHVALVCGHYEGVDERFAEQAVDVEVSVGDCVLTGGEIPAMAIVDAVSRLIPGVVGKSEAVTKDSFYGGMLDYPHYTRPASWNGREVPEVLLSGDAAQIEEWRRSRAVARTLSRRPDLLARCGLGGYLRGGFYLAAEGTLADVGRVREWADLCGSYGAVLLLFPASDSGDREKIREAIRMELESADDKKPSKVKSLPFFKLLPSFDHLLRWVGEKEKKKGRPLLVGVSDKKGHGEEAQEREAGGERDGARHWLDVKRFLLEERRPVVFCFRSRIGSEEEYGRNLERCDVRMIPPEGGRLPLSGEIAAVLDRFLGSR
ncbi:MAG: tRNA (guanosine(37)-N1)-methyltransferase TrmD [Synergistaceae bacterium]|jgi:tRNA (guanine37-N1)-methyltransferase|nr:tRNA (guanosine(37)-N1)-methyltransferase TrmD [Synergistaceae bacterium]